MNITYFEFSKGSTLLNIDFIRAFDRESVAKCNSASMKKKSIRYKGGTREGVRSSTHAYPEYIHNAAEQERG